MLADATCEGLTGTLLAFSIPENIKTPAEFRCKFDTSDKHVCWYEGTAILKVLDRRVGRSQVPESDETVKDADQAPAKPAQPADAKTETRE